MVFILVNIFLLSLLLQSLNSSKLQPCKVESEEKCGHHISNEEEFEICYQNELTHCTQHAANQSEPSTLELCQAKTQNLCNHAMNSVEFYRCCDIELRHCVQDENRLLVREYYGMGMNRMDGKLTCEYSSTEEKFCYNEECYNIVFRIYICHIM